MIGARVKITEPRGFSPCPYWDLWSKKLTRIGTIEEINIGGHIKLKTGETEWMSWTLAPGTVVEFL